MKSKLFTIRDAAAGIYMSVWSTPTTAMAIRSFAEECTNQQSPMSKNPTDYELFEIGEFDNETGMVIETIPRSIARATDYKDSTNATQPEKTRQ
ncbi:MAG: nonstructural protein [Microvirus sp.]|nr:MAG: nonstructural protein [Microvirus sp.]